MNFLSTNEVRSLIDSGADKPFVGKEIGELNFHGQIFRNFVNFSGAVFKETANFGYSEFWEGADFTGAVFERGVNFHNSRFRKPVQFSFCKFVNYVSFWKALFVDGADFTEISVYPLQHPAPSPFQPGEANFSWCCFKADASFTAAQFFGPAYFWRTIFYSAARFAGSRFYDRAWFNGNRTEIQFSKGVFSHPDLCNKLINAGILRISEDGHRKRGNEDSYENVLFRNILSEKDLLTKLNVLNEPALSLQDIEILRQIWLNGSKKMFGQPKEVTFRAASFHNKEETQFIDLDFDIKRSIKDAGIFISYSHKDVKWLNLILGHIDFLEKVHGVEVWKDGDIKPGKNWDREIKETIEKSKVALLLVTKAFLKSKYIMETELRIMQEQKEASDSLEIFWVPIEKINYKEQGFSKFHAAHSPKHPIAELAPEELTHALKKIAEKLALALGVNT